MADEKKAIDYEEQAPPAGLGGSKVLSAPQTEWPTVRLRIENLDVPTSYRKDENPGRIMTPRYRDQRQSKNPRRQRDRHYQ